LSWKFTRVRKTFFSAHIVVAVIKQMAI